MNFRWRCKDNVITLKDSHLHHARQWLEKQQTGNGSLHFSWQTACGQKQSTQEQIMPDTVSLELISHPIKDLLHPACTVLGVDRAMLHKVCWKQQLVFYRQGRAAVINLEL